MAQQPGPGSTPIKVHVQRPVEPFSAIPWKNEYSNRWAKCDAYYQLLMDLRRYVRGEIKGRSLLIAGHRGSGKSMLTMLAIQDLQVEVAPTPTGPRPQAGFLAWLRGSRSHGGLPTSSDSKSSGNPAHEGDNAQTRDGARALAFPIPVVLHGPTLLRPREERSGERSDPEQRMVQNVLHEIVRGLHRALCEEMAARYERRADERRKTETAARLRRELDKTPSLGLLRRFWHRIDALHRGVMPEFQGGRPTRLGVRPESNKGMREIYAIYTATEALRILDRGPEVDASHLSEKASRIPREQVLELLRAGTPLLSIIPGGIIAFGLAKEMSITLGIMVGFLVTVVTGMLLRKITASIDQPTLSPDGSVSSLERLVPLLVERAFDAGVAPVFVVDELDKVDDLAEKMDNFSRYLRHFVSDYAFFCFLTDRAYLEELTTRERTNAEPDQPIYIGDRVMVHYQPTRLKNHLKTCLSLLDPQQEPARDMLISRLLHMSQLQPGLLWQIIDMESENGVLAFDATASGYEYARIAQGEIEDMLNDPVVVRNTLYFSHFAQLAADALYFPSTKWKNATEPLRITEEILNDYLHRRIGVSGRFNRTGSYGRLGPPRRVPSRLSESELKQLARVVETLLQRLSDRGLLREFPSGTWHWTVDEPGNETTLRRRLVPGRISAERLRAIEDFLHGRSGGLISLSMLEASASWDPRPRWLTVKGDISVLSEASTEQPHDIKAHVASEVRVVEYERVLGLAAGARLQAILLHLLFKGFQEAPSGPDRVEFLNGLNRDVLLDVAAAELRKLEAHESSLAILRLRESEPALIRDWWPSFLAILVRVASRGAL